MVAPADPVLASTIWTTHIDRFGPNTTTQWGLHESHRLSTGSKAINAMLDGGLEFGSIHCISTERNQGAHELVQTCLLKHMLGSLGSKATYVDASHALDIRKLDRAIQAILRLDTSEDEARQQSRAALERLSIMKVFDFVGLAEGVAEVRNCLDKDEDGRHLLIIDNITQLVSPLLQSSLAQGNAVLASFMRSLRQVVHQHDLCVIMVNVGSARANAKESLPSIFQSCTLRPPLGRSFTHWLDTHLLVHHAPLRQADARTMRGHSDLTCTETASVMEIVLDRYGNRVGRWVPFRVDGEGRVVELQKDSS